MGLSAMKKRHLHIMICGMMLAILLPTTILATAMRTASEPETCGFFDKTTIYGFALYLGRDDTGELTHLYALRLRYITVSLGGEHNSGFIRLRRIDVPTRMTGYQGNLFFFASFRGSIDI